MELGSWGNSDDPRFNYPRPVDYGSAASLLVDAEIWGTLGGFDEQFAPHTMRTLIFVSLSGPWEASHLSTRRGSDALRGSHIALIRVRG